MLRQVRQLILVPLVFGACTKEPAKPAPAETPEADTYAVSISPHAPYANGKEGTASVTVSSKNGFHVNPDYPVAFKVVGSQGVKFADEHLRLTAATKTPCAGKTEDSCSIEFPLALTPEAAGPAKVAGVLAFSVCSADTCLIEKVPLSLAIAVD